MPALQRDQSSSASPPSPGWARLVRHAFGRLIERAAAVDGRPMAVTLVSESCLQPLLRDLEALAAAAAVDVRLVTGPDIGRRLATTVHALMGIGGPPPLVIVDRIDEIAAGDAPRAAGMLDELARLGASTCVTIGRGGGADDLAADLQSRLAEGLVVHVPIRPADQPPGRTTWSLPRIVRSAARRHGLSATTLVGGGRSRSVVQARNLAMYLARTLTGSSFGTIGGAFGGRDHTTVMRGVRAIESRLAEDAAFAAEVAELIAAASGTRRLGGRAS